MPPHPPVSRSRLTATDALLARGVDDGIFTHAACCLVRGGETVWERAFGAASLDTLFDLASLTKPLSTATLVLQLIDGDVLHLTDTLPPLLPSDFGVLPHLAPVTLHHLLTHTSGLPAIPEWPEDGAAVGRDACLRAAFATPPLRPPGTMYTYSDAGYILLGELAACAAGQPLEALFQERIAAPLGLRDTGFRPLPAQFPRLASTMPSGIPGEVHDPRARDLGGVAGHAGLFGTVTEAAKLAETIRTGGGSLLSRASALMMQTSQISPSLGGQSLGWFCGGNPFLPSCDLFSPRAFGHSGFTGTLILIDPAFDFSLVLLTNRVVNTAEDGARYLRLRRLWLNAVAAALL